MASPRLSVIRNLFAALRIASRPGGPSIGERLAALPRLVRAVARGEYAGATTGRLLLMVGALGWLLSPIDLMPEAVLGVFGLVDDAMIVSWLVTTVVTETEDYLAWEKGVAATAHTPSAGAGGAGGSSAASGSRGGGAGTQTVPGHVIR